MENLDRIDLQLITLLRNNARASNKYLAEQVGLAPSSCLARVQSLTARGVITGYHAELDPAMLGYALQAMIAVTLTRHDREDLESFRAFLLSLPEVAQLYHVAGPTDFMVHVTVADAAHLRELVLEAFTAREEVKHIETELIFEHRRALSLPLAETPDPV